VWTICKTTKIILDAKTHRGQRDAQRKSGHSEHGPDEEVSHANERGQPAEARLAGPANGPAGRYSIGTRDGSIIASIITTHMPTNDVAVAAKSSADAEEGLLGSPLGSQAL